MADFFNPATAPIPPAPAIEDRHFAEPRRRAKAKPLVRRVEEPVAEAAVDEPEEGETRHALDLDA
ncbi:MAG: hypothetical protein ACRD3D_10535 [Terriglobia bacterium]